MPAIDWMQKGPLGVMVHWISSTAPCEAEPEDDWDAKVDAFPVEAFCDTVAGTGARWLIFPFGQNTGKYCSPNPYLESLMPGACSRRDLMREIAEGLDQRGIRLVTYLPTEVVNQTEEVHRAFGWDLDPVDKSEFMRRYVPVVRTWSERFGKLISGWWFDGCYEQRRTNFTWGNERFEGSDWGEAVRAGNPDSIYALNPGANTFQYVSEDEDYVGGEANDITVKPGRPLIGDKQWHALVWTDCVWGHEQPGPMTPPRFSDEDLFLWVYQCHVNGGAVTLNFGISQEATFCEDSVRQVTEIARRIKAIDAGTEAPPEMWWCGKPEADGDT